MCARYSLVPDEFRETRIEFKFDPHFTLARYNIAPSWAPGHEAPIVVSPIAGRQELVKARFWMIPGNWRRPLRGLPTAFNARSEDIATKPFWKGSFERKRCLVPTTGWREFQGPAGSKRAFQFHHDGGFAFAGLWDEWLPPGSRADEPFPSVRSFSIITVPASQKVNPIHPRMPLRVAVGDYERWLDPAVDGPGALLSVLGNPLPEPVVYECDALGNDSRREGPECIAPVRKQQLDLF